MLSDLAFALAARGHTIEVITSRLTYDGTSRLPQCEIAGGVTIHRVSTTAFGRAKLIGRTLDYVTFFLAAAISLLARAKRGDIIVVKTDPPLLSVLVAPIAWMNGARHINWLQDIFPEVASALGIGQSRLHRWAISLLRWVRDLTLRRADANVVLGKRMAIEVQKRGVNTEQIAVIANWADGNDIHPIERERNALRKQWGLEDFFVVGYSGNLGRAHSVETFLGAITILEGETRRAATPLVPAHAGQGDGLEELDDSPPTPVAIRWLFIGGGAQMEHLKLNVEAGRHESVMFRPYQPRDRLAQSLSVPDVHLISLRPELEGFIVPSKYYGIAASGRPAIFVGDPNGEIARIIRRNATGFVVREGDGARLAQVILMLARHQVLAARQGARARRLFESDYDLPVAVAAWEDLIRKVCQQTRIGLLSESGSRLG